MPSAYRARTLRSLTGIALLFLSVKTLANDSASSAAFCELAVTSAFDLRGAETWLADTQDIVPLSMYRGRSAMFYAAVLGKSGYLNMWLRSNEAKKLVDVETVFASIQNGQLDTIKQMHDEGVSVSLRDSLGTTATIVAAQCGRSRILYYLKSVGLVDLTPNDDGVDPMAAAILSGCVGCVELIIQSGYDIQRRIGPRRVTPLDVARATGNREIERLLETATHEEGKKGKMGHSQNAAPLHQ